MTAPVPPITPAPAAPPLPQGDARVTILNVPASLQSVPRTVQVVGQVAQQNSDGSTVIDTKYGPVTAIIRSPQPPAQGQAVELDIAPGQPPRQAVVRVTVPDPQTAPDTPVNAPSGNAPANAAANTTVNTTPTAPAMPESTPATGIDTPVIVSTGALASPLEAAPPALPPEPAAAAAPALTLPPVRTLALLPLPARTAILPAPPPATVAPLPTPPIMPKGPISQLLQLLKPASPDLPAATLPAAPPAQTAPPGLGRLIQDIAARLSKNPQAGPALPETAPGPATMPSAPSKPGLPPLAVTLRSVIRPDGTVLPAAHDDGPVPQPGDIVAAKIQGFTRQGLPVLSLTRPGESAPQSLILPVRIDGLGTGDRIALTVEPQAALPEVPAETIPITSLADNLAEPVWPALQTLSEAAQDSPPLQMALARTLPNPAAPAQIPPATLLFIAAAQSGDIEHWLGDKTIDLIRRASSKPDLIARLAGDLSTVGRTSTQPVAQDWKALPLPLYYDGQIDKAMVWFRHDRDPDDKDGDKPRQTRFIFDLTLTRMGAVQLDGLAKPARIDLIVRTMQPVGDGMRGIMRQKFTNALEQIEFTGDLSFQGKVNFVVIDIRKASPHRNV